MYSFCFNFEYSSFLVFRKKRARRVCAEYFAGELDSGFCTRRTRPILKPENSQITMIHTYKVHNYTTPSSTSFSNFTLNSSACCATHIFAYKPLKTTNSSWLPCSTISPSRMTMILVHFITVLNLCATKTLVRSLAISSKLSKICDSVAVSSAGAARRD